jgi:hypothetical protein
MKTAKAIEESLLTQLEDVESRFISCVSPVCEVPCPIADLYLTFARQVKYPYFAMLFHVLTFK